MSDTATILKPNATAHDRAIEQAILKGDPDLSPVAKLMNPETCPPHLLAWLAWSFSVEVWDSNWSLSRKRSVIASSVAVHRRKGTLGAVKRALRSLDFHAEISEWFDHGGDPHTFRVYAASTDVFDAGFGLDSALAQQVHSVIDTVKPARSHYSLLVGEEFDTATYLRTGSTQLRRDPIASTLTTRSNEMIQSVKLRSGSRPVSLMRAQPVIQPRDEQRVSSVVARCGTRLSIGETQALSIDVQPQSVAAPLILRSGFKEKSHDIQSYEVERAMTQSHQFGGRFYFDTDNRWVSTSAGFGLATENHSQNGGVGADPAVAWYALGLPLRQSDRVTGVTILGRTSNAQVTSVDFRLYYQTGPWDGTWDSDAEVTRTLLVSQSNLFPVDNDMTKYSFDADYIAPSEGFLIPFFKPSGTLTARHSVALTGLIDVRSATLPAPQ